MTDINEDTIKEEMVALFEKHGDALLAADEGLLKIEEEGVELFEKKLVALKNKLVHDETISEDDLQKRFLEELDTVRAEVLEETEKSIQVFLSKNGVTE
jgi:hypothetical protein